MVWISSCPSLSLTSSGENPSSINKLAWLCLKSCTRILFVPLSLQPRSISLYRKPLLTSKSRSPSSYLHANFNSPISNTQIASKFGYHPNYLSNLFVKITGKSMHQYLISLRIARAAELLETGKLPVAQVAVTCGFENSSKFSAMFKKEFGRTQTQYRKNSRLQ